MKIKQLHEFENGAVQDVAPVTIPDAVVNPDTQENLTTSLGRIETSIGEKVDKVDGKQLSTEDFTTALKEKLESLENYDDTEISQAVETLRSDFDTLVSGNTSSAIETFNEIIAFLDGIEDSQSLDSIIASIEQQIAAKGTVKSITAGDGLEGGTITDSGTIALPVIGAITKSGKGNTGGSSSSDMLVSSSSGTVVTGITTDEYGRVTSVTTGSVINTYPTGLRNTYAGGTAVTLNGSSKGSSTASFYAPTSVGASGAILKSNGSGAPSWMYIKTINGESILGEGDIAIKAGAGFVAQTDEPEDTSLLWVDTDDTTDETDSIIGVDAYMSDTSVNPVQNAVVKQYIDSRMVAVTEAEYEALGDSVNSDGVLYLITE